MPCTKQRDLLPGFLAGNDTSKPVNVATVPQRSPFRYPGGKTWFVPTFRKWVKQIYPKPRLLVEPFAGGGIITLTALFEDLAESAVMVEIDEEIAAVWQAVADGDSKWLANRILNFDLTKESVLSETAKKPASNRESAFQTILKNRTLHGGIICGGSGFLKYGENGKGILSRWYPATLARRFEHLDRIKDRIEFRREDGLDTLREYAENSEAIFFIDPPYTVGGKKAGRRLYRHCHLDHERLFAICEDIKGNFLLTYDNAEEVRMMAHRHSFQMRLIPMTGTHNTKMEELVIGKNLDWLDDLPAVHKPKSESRQLCSTKKLSDMPCPLTCRFREKNKLYL